MINYLLQPHFLTADELDRLDAGWPATDWPGWHRYQEDWHGKRASNLHTALPEVFGPVLARLAQLSHRWTMGFDRPSVYLAGLIPDLSLHGAGLHEMVSGARLGRHLDARSRDLCVAHA